MWSLRGVEGCSSRCHRFCGSETGQSSFGVPAVPSRGRQGNVELNFCPPSHTGCLPPRERAVLPLGGGVSARSHLPGFSHQYIVINPSWLCFNESTAVVEGPCCFGFYTSQRGQGLG